MRARISSYGSSAKRDPRIVVRRFADGEEHAIAFDEAAALGISAGYEYDTSILRFTYSSMTTPSQVFDYDMNARTRTLRKTQEVPSGHKPSRYVTRRVMAPAKDGETVPVSLLFKKDTKLDGSAPLLLYGYGAYGMAIPAGFSTNALSPSSIAVSSTPSPMCAAARTKAIAGTGQAREEGEQLRRFHRGGRVCGRVLHLARADVAHGERRRHADGR
jgi:hypothetical protein